MNSHFSWSDKVRGPFHLTLEKPMTVITVVTLLHNKPVDVKLLPSEDVYNFLESSSSEYWKRGNCSSQFFGLITCSKYKLFSINVFTGWE